ncbi:hypothetical protein LSAT2_029967 [Lamellibrachia satsuma]|nr:hypothetical protein LSAT2_029967 [Lamellibrachia satsuma]
MIPTNSAVRPCLRLCALNDKEHMPLLLICCVLALLASPTVATVDGYSGCLQLCDERYGRCMRACKQNPERQAVNCFTFLFNCTVQCRMKHMGKQ